MFKIYKLYKPECLEHFSISNKVYANVLIEITQYDLDYDGYFDNNFNTFEEAKEVLEKYKDSWINYTILQIF